MLLPVEAFKDDAANYLSRRFWNNELIWKEIISYLSGDDLFSLAKTNRHFYSKVISRWSRRQTLAIKDEEDFKLRTKYKFYNRPNHLVIINRGTLSKDIIVSGLIKILSKCRNLDGLLFESHEFFEKKYAALFRNKYIRYRFSKLKLLEVGRIREEDIYSNSENLLDKNSRFVPTYKYFRHIDMQLTSFFYREPDLTAPVSLFQPELILCTSLCSLTSLTLEISSAGLKPLQKLRFLRLQKLTLMIVYNSRPTEDSNENLPNGNVIINEGDDIANDDNFFNNEAAHANEEPVIDNRNDNENESGLEDISSGSFESESDENDSDESDSDEEDDEGDVNPYISEYLFPFLQNHVHTLKTVKMYFVGVFSLKPLFETFKDSKKMEFLNVHCIFGSDENFLNEIDWSVLRFPSTLKGFKIKFAYERSYYASDEDFQSDDEDSDEDNDAEHLEVPEVIAPVLNGWNLVLNSLPCSTEHISLCDFQYSGHQDEILSVGISSIGKFENLIALKMEKCPDFFNDDTLQFICKTLIKLRKLKGEFHKVTDFGISGLKEDGSDSGVSLRNLKGLQKLVIYSGSGTELDNKLCFSWAGLLRSVAFFELSRLKIIGSLKDVHMDGRKANSKDGHNFLKLVEQNPSLRNIVLSFYTPLNWFHEQVSKRYPRIHLPEPSLI